MSLIFESYHMLDEKQSAKLFNGLVAVSQIFGIAAVLCVAIWMGGFDDGGFSWEDPAQTFHYHPVLMSMGLIFLLGEAILVYRVFRGEPKRFTKLLHGTIHSIALIFMIIALRAVWDSHDYHKNPQGELDPIPNLYSLHSWVGFSMVLLACVQYVAGFTTFFYPGFAMEIRKFVLPFHQLTGILILIGVTVAALMGISEHAAWKHTCWTKEKQFCGKQAIANFAGLFLVGYTAIIVVIILNPRWKRKPLPEEESLHNLVND
ncbi:Protein F55H2.5 [Aphelenchoides avenae]|nr:Protein F55H2.5 [Aphelenchus avenae]